MAPGTESLNTEESRPRFGLSTDTRSMGNVRVKFLSTNVPKFEVRMPRKVPNLS